MRVQRGLCAALVSVATLAGCTDVSTASDVPVSLQFDSLPALAVVVGDTMRGDSLVPQRVPVRAFDGNGGLVRDSLLRIIGIDTTSVGAFRLGAGFRIIGVREASAVRVVAQAGSLQSQTQTFAVVPAPTAIVRNAGSDSIVYTRTDTVTMSVNLIRRVAAESTLVPLNGLRVAFRVDSFSRALLDSVQLLTGAGRVMTSALVSGGAATVRLKIFPRATGTGTGVVLLRAAHTTRGSATPGSPLALPVRIVRGTNTSGSVTRQPDPLAPARALP